MSRRHIAVLGGGISGLSGAYHLSRRFPDALVTVVEKSDRFGGSIRSLRVRIADNDQRHFASVLVESGPRTLRASNAAHVLELINLLNLSPSVITTPTTSPAARNRFLHLPPSPGLARVPTSLASLLLSKLGRTVLLPALARDLFSPPNRLARRRGGGSEGEHKCAEEEEEEEEDESVDAFLARHFGPGFARTFGSALVHGIYAADARALSVRAAFPALAALSDSGRGSVLRGALRLSLARGHGNAPGKGKEMEVEMEGAAHDAVRGASVFSFRDGMQTLPDALADALRKTPNVRLLARTAVGRIAHDRATDTIELELKDAENGERVDVPGPPVTHVLSALPLPALSSVLRSSHSHSHSSSSSYPLRDIPTEFPSATVTVVNLVFPPTPSGAPLQLHPAGFGYLVPRPERGYDDVAAASNPLGVLGAVFDSCALGGAQDYALPPPRSSPFCDGKAEYGSSRFAKITVMLGGPYHRHRPDRSAPVSPRWVDELVHGHLRGALAIPAEVELPEPAFAMVRTHVRCIPSFAPGHLGAVRKVRAAARAIVGGEEGGGGGWCWRARGREG
ncbi:FAD/NAD(P)-binding domain-containing protein [Punctularia strigosozonata HHB-11173 SS5]|uniref:FAD/NAD(P)-binding domain-containing protein n=1 Tax=Punctularia strigosozonata (strain HHB-11173) TaxID=741275 RepID=UPI0004416E29|nr:FAD/NAD(P)-binding domain-containing protein [Punctularia strigosozonata HHB-11173 SS5]EIN08516.1 FAD/NAD(P)-binding domain-containing protein [Punctularia strigosozonata HHB-11173 SS5]